MNKQMAQHVAALVEGIFDATAAELRQHEPDAYASRDDFGPNGTQTVISLDFGRNGGNWQRSLVVIIEAEQDRWAIEVAIYNEEQAPIIKIASVTVANEDLADMALALARAGRSRLIAELGQPVAA